MFNPSRHFVCPFCAPARDDGDGAVAIMCVNGRCDGCDRDCLTDESRARKVDKELRADRGDCLRSRARMHPSLVAERLGC